ncbi:MAG: primosomal protein N' [Chloroflexi bacterium]|nr:primosomal protein N' [Chloroflexota bacterium]
MPFAEIAVDIPGDRGRTFTYSVPSGMDARPGHVVWVPFGRQTVQGIVFGLAETTSLAGTREILRYVHEKPLLTLAQLEVARWVADYYRVGLFLATSQVLPSGLAEEIRTYVTVAGDRRRPSDLGVREARALEWVRGAGKMRRDLLGRKLGRGGLDVVDRLARRRLLVTSTVVEPARGAHRYSSFLRLAVPAEQAEAAATASKSSKRAAALRALAAERPGIERAELARSHGAAAIAALIKLGLATVERVRVERDPLSGLAFQQSFPLNPTPAQKLAIDAIATELLAPPSDQHRLHPERRRFLLYGVTGSGKTEIYLRAAEACLAARRRVIVLVPEVALTPQNLQRFASRFPGRIALLHSGLSAGERFDQWWRVHAGDFPIVLGSRGAIFAPVNDLGLVIIDEEHEWTYKQHDAAPRFHARAVAEKLCQAAGGVLVVGSATPDIETFRRAERGDYRLLRLPERVRAAAKPPPLEGGGAGAGDALRLESGRTAAGQAGVEIVDMRAELRSGNPSIFSRALEAGIREALEAGGRAILFLNRRGSAGFLQCRKCGHTLRCRRCATTLALHSPARDGESARLVCHHCNQQTKWRPNCPGCGAAALASFNPGTQAVADEVERSFPEAGVLRWDRDIARTARDHAAVLKRFLEGPERVLVGTQMVAKGLDIPAVTLVGVVSADTGLAIPDFRAGERAFQVLTQVAGRAGRGKNAGRVIIQTFQPEHYAIQAAADQDFDAFYRVEIKLRAEFDYPPFSRLILLEYAAGDPTAAFRHAEYFARVLRHERLASGEGSTQILGPTPGYPFRVRGLTRWHITLKGEAPSRLLDRVPLPKGWAVDVDPVSVS